MWSTGEIHINGEGSELKYKRSYRSEYLNVDACALARRRCDTAIDCHVYPIASDSAGPESASKWIGSHLHQRLRRSWYSSHLPTLSGARVDGRKMCETMELLNFETHWERNATATVTRRLVRETARCQYLSNYKRLVFIFSGHGTTKHCLYTQDGKQVNFHDIMKQFYPGQSPHLGAIPKLFFIDACRGSLQTQAVLVTKGGHDVSLKVPEQSNFLVAYSTMPDHRAHESKETGGSYLDEHSRRETAYNRCICS